MLIKCIIRNKTIVNSIFNYNKQTSALMKTHFSQDIVKIGEISKDISKVKNPQYLSLNYYHENIPQNDLHHLRWMMQKDLLGQDIFLLGPPGPRKRTLTMQYLELTNREHEYVTLSRDTTESDLKQRREIVNGTAKYYDQSAVRAAINGRILILEGIEKAERNVLPVLNNLLENREMHLEDGRLLIPASRYDKLLKEHGKETLEKWKLARVDDSFRVIALGLPVPKYRGNPLDPPLRSRFQARDVTSNSYHEWYQKLLSANPKVPKELLKKVLSCAFGIMSKECAALGLSDFPLDNLPVALKIAEANPQMTPYELVYLLYPYKTFLKDGIEHVESLLSKLEVNPPSSNREVISEKIANFFKNNKKLEQDSYVDTKYQSNLLKNMLETAKVSDFCLVGTGGCGKSMLVNKVGEMLGKDVENIVLYQDMTARDLIQQRTTLDTGDTIWKFSPLVTAALEGKIAVLDGIHRIHPSTLSILHRLVHDRELQLHDGKRLIKSSSYNQLQTEFGLTKEALEKSGIFEIHPEFRIIVIGEPPNFQSPTGNWLSPELLSLFVFHEMRTLSKQEEMHIITSKYGPIPKPLFKIMELAHLLRNSSDTGLKNLSGHLSTRQLLRIASRMKLYPTDNAYEILEEAFMIKFLPLLTRQILEKTIGKVGIEHVESKNFENIKCEVKDGILTIGESSMAVYNPKNVTKVPDILFYDVPQHLQLMERLLQDFQLGYHLLLVGNQGVGKNKIADRFLELLNRPREYIQLHRDTTVQTLTTQPTVKDGVLIHEDSPLVKAIKSGHVLVIDEADKAPTHVTCILKTLVESGRMILSDGRRIVSKIPPDCKNPDNYIETHPDFRIIVLANRPGFPFLGNDFFGALGDLFSSHSVENPSRDSEISLLQQYGPNVPVRVIRKLVDVFNELRTMADQGLINYPYSTREVVNIVKHLERFPKADVEDVVFNVFDFDRYSPEMIDTVGEVLVKHGFDKNIISADYVAAKRAKEDIQVTVKRYSGLDTKGPKHGKEDPKNDPHVGGNTWAGGTGGRDTAGLGGKGGPYRLDAGHKVFQLSDEEKNAVPEHIQKAAREMGRKAFQEKLHEIKMSAYDHNVYVQFSHAVARQVQTLRVILGTLQAKNKERQWTRHQTTGELDDIKLIDGLLGEKTIFRRRTEQQPELGTPQIKPKLFRVVADVSGSMYRFNSYDGRLDKELEAITMVMEAFEGFEDKIKYDVIGHSGDDYNVRVISRDDLPKNNKERLDVLKIMHAHSQYCWSGDNTLASTEWAISNLAEEDCDEAILILLSDANLQRYGISASRLATVLSSKPNVSAYAIFIGSLGDQAERLTETLPTGRAFICNDTKELPQILKQIFSTSFMSV